MTRISLSKISVGIFTLALLASAPVLSADKSITPDGKPAPSKPHAKPGSKAAQEEEAASKTPYATVRDVFSGDETIAGEKITFPQSNPSVKAIEITMEPGEVTKWHQHHAPLFAYVLEGEITVTYEELGKKVYRAGEGLLEAMDVTHRGQNTGEAPARILAVFLLGDDGVATVAEDNPGANKNKVE
ncbi:cupin domain-containing protein [Stappia sp. BW2]|uniref:cupin domain-containing protein n=1 Tax=Stappia sp. BW2 TaxID=2592622 RepID=UPI0011DEF511|nr:cupin domain-containing protein [Stappia sp. BW2]TYC66078.1 cupin domain-containing protein [Stappia sp. BW2]